MTLPYSRKPFTLPANLHILGTMNTVEGIDLPRALETINARLKYLIGHAWLMGVWTRADVDGIMRCKIVPPIAKYFHDDWNKVRAVLGGTDDFVRRERLAPPPSFDDDTDEDRSRWTVRDPFEDGAYDRLISGAAPDAEPGAE